MAILYTSGVLCNVEWCNKQLALVSFYHILYTRSVNCFTWSAALDFQLSCPSIVSSNVTSTAHNHNTNITLQPPSSPAEQARPDKQVGQPY